MSPKAAERLKFIAEANACLGKPYIWGANGPDSFDCSGLVLHAYRSAGGKAPDMTCEGLASLCRKNGSLTTVAADELHLADILPGTLCFYGFSISRPTHVMIAFGDGRVIGASGGGRGTTQPVPGRCVKFQPKPDYRPDLVAVGELPLFL